MNAKRSLLVVIAALGLAVPLSAQAQSQSQDAAALLAQADAAHAKALALANQSRDAAARTEAGVHELLTWELRRGVPVTRPSSGDLPTDAVQMQIDRQVAHGRRIGSVGKWIAGGGVVLAVAGAIVSAPVSVPVALGAAAVLQGARYWIEGHGELASASRAQSALDEGGNLIDVIDVLDGKDPAATGLQVQRDMRTLIGALAPPDGTSVTPTKNAGFHH